MKKLVCAAAALLLALACLTAGAEEAWLTPIADAGEALLFDTHNVTLNGRLTFTLDGERFKTADCIYIQDGFNSLWDVRLTTPRGDHDQDTGFTVTANEGDIYVTEYYWPGLYREGSDDEQNTLVRRSLYLDQLVKLCRGLVPQLETGFADRVTLTQDDEGQLTSLTLSGEDIPEAATGLMNIGAQLLIKRYFGQELDDAGGYEPYFGMADYFSPTAALLNCTRSFTPERIDLAVRLDSEGKITLMEGDINLNLDAGQDGMHKLEISFSVAVSKYGGSEVAPFDPDGLEIWDGTW
ncbi:MAG: hypothetical protein IKP40_02170 [Clostridia bacterium]|nr:hypothetical protein [Clostridia bacterium]